MEPGGEAEPDAPINAEAAVEDIAAQADKPDAVIALLLDDGSLISGDVLENRAEPRLGSIMDDVPAAEASLRRLGTLSVGTVYPGHGTPFEFGELETPLPR